MKAGKKQSNAAKTGRNNARHVSGNPKKRKWLFCLLTAAILLLSVVLFYTLKGYGMYRSAVKECPVAEKVGQIQSSPHYTRLDDLPDIYPKAVLAAEDHRFYKHGAIDVLSIIRAVWVDVTSFSLKEGGSTITQQLAKNIYFTQERRLERKIAEIFAAFALERECTKDEILEMYINTIYYGAGYYCVYDASVGYFDCTPDKMSDYQCTLLAGLPNAPSVYALSSNPDLAVQRQTQVLAKMVKHGYISKEKAEEIVRTGGLS